MASSFRKFSETWHGSGPITEFQPERISYARSLKQMRPAIELNDIIYRGFVTSINLRLIYFISNHFFNKKDFRESNLAVSMYVCRKTLDNSNWWNTVDTPRRKICLKNRTKIFCPIRLTKHWIDASYLVALKKGIVYTCQLFKFFKQDLIKQLNI
jgi:hypothetical protein